MNSASAIEVMPSQVVRIRKAISAMKADDHEHVAMGEVHHADDAEHHRVADGDQAVDRAERDAVDELLEKDFHRVPIAFPKSPGRFLRINRDLPQRQRRARCVMTFLC